MKWMERIARYFLGVWFLICAVDGWGYLFFDYELTGDHSGFEYLPDMMETTYFWAFLKVVQTVGAISLLANYRPAMGLALITPISAVLVLFYIFELPSFIPIGVLIVISTGILFRAYSGSFRGLMDTRR